MNTQDLQQGRGVGGGGNPAQASSHPVLQPFSALVTDPPVSLGVQSGEGEGWGLHICIYVRVRVCVGLESSYAWHHNLGASVRRIVIAMHTKLPWRQP